MPRFNNAMDVFKHLEKSNCRECGEKTCLAFAAAVYLSRKQIDMCPRTDEDVIRLYSGDHEANADDELGVQILEGLMQALSETDLAEAAERAGGRYDGRRLTLRMLGKDFSVDAAGNFKSDIHVKPWVTGPFLKYVLYGKGVDPAGEWVSYRELKEAKDFSYPFFQKRCESAMKQVADTYTDLFDDLVHIFGGREVEAQFESDISVVLHPLPRVPIMICYWGSDGELGSTLNIFFDKSADVNLPNGALFAMCVGLAVMFEKLSERHAKFVAM